MIAGLSCELCMGPHQTDSERNGNERLAALRRRRLKQLAAGSRYATERLSRAFFCSRH